MDSRALQSISADVIISGFAAVDHTPSQKVSIRFLAVVESFLDSQIDAFDQSQQYFDNRLDWSIVSNKMAEIGCAISPSDCCRLWKFLAYKKAFGASEEPNYNSDIEPLTVQVSLLRHTHSDMGLQDVNSYSMAKNVKVDVMDFASVEDKALLLPLSYRTMNDYSETFVPERWQKNPKLNSSMNFHQRNSLLSVTEIVGRDKPRIRAQRKRRLDDIKSTTNNANNSSSSSAAPVPAQVQLPPKRKKYERHSQPIRATTASSSTSMSLPVEQISAYQRTAMQPRVNAEMRQQHVQQLQRSLHDQQLLQHQQQRQKLPSPPPQQYQQQQTSSYLQQQSRQQSPQLIQPHPQRLQQQNMPLFLQMQQLLQPQQLQQQQPKQQTEQLGANSLQQHPTTSAAKSGDSGSKQRNS